MPLSTATANHPPVSSDRPPGVSHAALAAEIVTLQEDNRALARAIRDTFLSLAALDLQGATPETVHAITALREKLRPLAGAGKGGA